MTTATKAEPKYVVTLTGNHRYLVNGKQKPGVTGILKVIDKPALNNWKCGTIRDLMAENPDRIESLAKLNDYMIGKEAMSYYMAKKGDAKEIGKEVHAVVEHFFKGEIDRIKIDEREDKVQTCYGAFLAWANMHELKPIDTEVYVYNDLLDYCGTLDWIGHVDGELTLIDYKTGKGIYDEALFQAAAYGRAWERLQITSGWGEKKIEQHMIIRFGKEHGEFEERTLTKKEAIQAFKAFQAAHALYEIQKDLKRKKG